MFQLLDNRSQLFGIAGNTTSIQPPPATQVEPRASQGQSVEDWPTPAPMSEPTTSVEKPKPEVEVKSGEQRVKPDVRDRVETIEITPAPKPKQNPPKALTRSETFDAFPR
jgi:hypothetical protein